jgi:hypothetical protein
MPGVAAAGEQAAPQADKVTALERELEETKQKVEAAETEVEEAKRSVEEAKRSVEEPGAATDISSYLQGLAPDQRAAVLADRRQELLRCSNALDKLRELLKSLNERLTLLQSQNRAGVTGAVGASRPSHLCSPSPPLFRDSLWRRHDLQRRLACCFSREFPCDKRRPGACRRVNSAFAAQPDSIQTYLTGSGVQQLRAENARLLARLEALEGQPGALFVLSSSSLLISHSFTRTLTGGLVTMYPP